MSWTDAKGAKWRRAEVEVTLLREAFLASGKSASSVATAMGWTRLKRNGNGHGPYVGGDSQRIRRALGLAECNQSHGYRGRRERCSYEMAVRLAEAIGV